MTDAIGGLDASPEIDKIAPALVRAVNAIQAVKKDAQGHGYRYADLASCVEEAKRTLGDHGMTVIQPLSLQSLADTRGGELTETTVAVIRTVVVHESGQWIASTVAVPDGGGAPKMSPTQVIGSNISYMKRYALCAMLSIPTEDDDGRGGYEARREPGRRDRDGRPGRERPASERAAPAAPTSLAYRDSIKTAVDGANAEWSAFANAEGVDAPLGLTIAKVESLLADKAVASGKATEDRFGAAGRRDPVKTAAYLSNVFGKMTADRIDSVVADVVSTYVAGRKVLVETEAANAAG